jgi:hypothetical protein
MKRRSIMAGALALALSAVPGSRVFAQWGYPVGYGGYGWGGWGATGQGDIARGMGAYAAGVGYYNKETAIANSINTDTVMRWNQYVYEAQENANRMHHAKLAQERYNTNKAADQIRDRLRNNPELADIYRGDAMNVALDEINNPRVYAKALEGGKVKLGGELIRNIPFQYAAAAITVSIYQLTRGGPPTSLLRPEFAAEREAIKQLGQELRKQIDEEKNPDPETIRKMLTAINVAEEKVDKTLPANTRDRNEADRYLKALHGLVAMLETPAIDVILSGVEKRPDASLGELLTFMNAFNLRFGAATTPAQRQAYETLYPKLVDLRNQVDRILATTSSPSGGAATGSEAGEFFSGMSYQDLKKKAPMPAPPAPSPPPQANRP